MPQVRIIGAGRAGHALARALRAVGHDVDGPLGRTAAIGTAAAGADVLVLAVPDDELAHVAAAIAPSPSCVVAHLSGSLGLDVLAPHPRRASLHPLVPLPNAEVGARRLLDGVTLAVAGDPVAVELAESLGARLVVVDDEDRAAYHAAACVAANHVVALLGQVERVAATIGLSVDAFLGLTRAALEDVAALGPRAALTGPAARGDWATIARHLDALDPQERAHYGAGVALALELAAGPSVSPALTEAPPVSAADAPR
ncbi:MAG TPA: Rossmann-like and DUF2520 domain-containing protein [Acidimicrobiales bacterium]|jgi:predicted short-subunit dehydrogenase-like oxidoreductase (DUF2520 family)|nr:Rossmann-like and DUF2520 domain-containing protein [Acidimicrobiales bacterium]